jgi:hypothetical protein
MQSSGRDNFIRRSYFLWSTLIKEGTCSVVVRVQIPRRSYLFLSALIKVCPSCRDKGTDPKTAVDLGFGSIFVTLKRPSFII